MGVGMTREKRLQF
jgi:GTPase SAR1 family protein